MAGPEGPQMEELTEEIKLPELSGSDYSCCVSDFHWDFYLFF